MATRHEQRLRKLEAANPDLKVDLRAEWARWSGLLVELQRLAPSDLGHLLPEFEAHFQMVKAYSEVGGPDLERCRRWPGALLALARKLKAADRLHLFSAPCKALTGNRTNGDNVWLGDWAGALCRLEGRLPPDLKPTAVAALVDYYERTPAPEVYSVPAVCDVCGLSRPGLAAEFAACPHCGQTAFTWRTLLNEEPHPWRDLAESELKVN